VKKFSCESVASSWRRWTEAALDRCLASLRAKRYRRRSQWVAQMFLCVNICERRTFWESKFILIMHMLFCISCLFILWTLSKCYCVICWKCSRISPILCRILQGSAATHLKCVWKYGTGFVANFSENTRVKEFKKSANICRSYERMYSGTVFWLTVYNVSWNGHLTSTSPLYIPWQTGKLLIAWERKYDKWSTLGEWQRTQVRLVGT